MKSIRTKIVVVFAVAAAAFLTVNVIVFATQAVLVIGYSRVTDTIVEEYRIMEAAPELVEAYNGLLKLPRSPERQARYDAIKDEIEAVISHLDASVVSRDSRLSLRGLKNSVAVMMTEGEKGIEEARLGEVEKYSIRFDEANRLAGFIRTNATELILKEINYARDQQQLLENNQRNASFAGAFLSLLIGLFAAAYVLGSTSRTLRPLGRLDDLVKSIAGGNLKVKVSDDLKDSGDEVGRLAGSVDTMASSLRDTIRRLEETNVRVKAIMENAPYGAHTYRLESDGRLVLVAANRSADEILKFDHRSLIDKTLEEAFPGNVGTEVPEAYRRVARTGETYERYDYAYSNKGIKGIFEVTAVQTGPDEVTAFFRDVSERYRNERALKVLSHCNEIIVRMEREEDLTREICAAVVEVGGYRMAWIGYAEDDAEKTVRPVAVAGHDDGFLAALKPSWADNERGNIPISRAIRTGEPFLSRSLSGGGSSLWERMAQEHGYGSVCALPLTESGRRFGGLAVIASEEDAFDEKEVSLLRELADDTAFGIQSIRERIARKRAEEEVRHNEEKYRAIVENSTDIICTFGEDGFVTYISPQIEAYGAKSEEVVGTKFMEFVNKNDRDRVAAEFEKMKERREGGTLEVHTAGPSGRDSWMEARVRVLDAAGEPSFLCVLRDITIQRAAEQALAESERRYRAYVENTEDVIFALDKAGNVTYASPQVRHYGVKAEDVVGRSFMEFIHPEDRGWLGERYRLDMEGKRQSELTTFRFVNGDGRVFWVEEVDNIEKDESGVPVGMIGTMRDVTERRAAEEKVAELNRLRTKFIQVISHQLRTPLNSIRWSLEALLSGEVGELKAEQRDFVKVVYDAELEIIGRIHEMITALDIEENRVTLEREEVAPVALVGSVVGELKAAADKRQVKIDYKAGADPTLTMQLDSERTRFVVKTLIQNAIIYGREGGEVKVETSHKDGIFRLAVSDGGIGIPEAEQANIFRRFFRASNASVVNQNASGLGLSISKYYVEKQGGRIGFESKPGEGTTFWVELPLKASAK